MKSARDPSSAGRCHSPPVTGHTSSSSTCAVVSQWVDMLRLHTPHEEMLCRACWAASPIARCALYERNRSSGPIGLHLPSGVHSVGSRLVVQPLRETPEVSAARLPRNSQSTRQLAHTPRRCHGNMVVQRRDRRVPHRVRQLRQGQQVRPRCTHPPEGGGTVIPTRRVRVSLSPLSALGGN